MRIIVDAMFPEQLVYRLRDLGAEVHHVRTFRQTGVDDDRMWEYACQNGFMIMTKDSDFLMKSKTDDRAKLVFVKFGNMRRDETVEFIGSKFAELERFAVNDNTVFII